mgnify:CR=1 FL=1
MLLFKQLEMVGNPVSREYCVISAYNTGPGNVLRTFNKNQADAVNEINRLELLGGLRAAARSACPTPRTRDYLQKVVGVPPAVRDRRAVGITSSSPASSLASGPS